MTDTTEGQETEQEQEQQAEPTAAEVQATKAGWRPKEEWDESGSAQWMDAEQFNERNERLGNRGNKILKAEISSLKRQVTGMEKVLKQAAQHFQKADARAYARAAKDLEAKADKAVEEGDTDAYRATKAEMKELEQEIKADAKQEATKETPSPDDDPIFQAWLPDNAWYDPKDEGFDAELASFADSIAPQIARTGLVGKPFYDRIAKEVQKKYLRSTGNPRRNQPSTVETGGGGGGSNGKTLWPQVPKIDQTVFKRFVTEGIYEDTKEDREKYADVYING